MLYVISSDAVYWLQHTHTHQPFTQGGQPTDLGSALGQLDLGLRRFHGRLDLAAVTFLNIWDR